MKIKKALLFVVVLLLSIVLLAGCGAEEEKKEKNNEVNQEQIKYSNLGSFAEYNGNIYYWQLTPECRENTALFARFGAKKGIKTDLIRREKDGISYTVLNDYGFGNIYVADNTIYYQINDNGTYKVCSIDPDGNKKTYVNGEIKYANNEYLYIQDLTDVVVLNTKTGIDELKVEKADLIGMADGNAYYISGDAGKEISINYINGTVNNMNIATFNTSEYKETEVNNANITVYDFSYANNKVAIKVGDVQGTGHFVQEGWIIEMDSDGKNVTKKQDSSQNEGADTLLDATELPVSYNTGKGLIYKDPANGSEKVILDNDKIKSEFGFTTYGDDEEAFIEVYSADKVGDYLYIVIDNGTHYPEGDIGWRYSYKRTKTAAFEYNIESKKVEYMYDF